MKTALPNLCCFCRISSTPCPTLWRITAKWSAKWSVDSSHGFSVPILWKCVGIPRYFDCGYLQWLRNSLFQFHVSFAIRAVQILKYFTLLKQSRWTSSTDLSSSGFQQGAQFPQYVHQPQLQYPNFGGQFGLQQELGYCQPLPPLNQQHYTNSQQQQPHQPTPSMQFTRESQGIVARAHLRQKFTTEL